MAEPVLGPGGTGTLEVSQAIQPGILTAVMFSVEALTIGPADLWVSIVIREPLTARTQPIYVLNSAYVSIDQPLTWQGFLAIDSNSEIHAQITGQLDGLMLLNFRRLTPIAGSAITRILKGVFRD